MKKHWVNLRIWMLFSSGGGFTFIFGKQRRWTEKKHLNPTELTKAKRPLASAGISSLPSLPRCSLAGLQTESQGIYHGPSSKADPRLQFRSPQVWATAESSVQLLCHLQTGRLMGEKVAPNIRLTSLHFTPHWDPGLFQLSSCSILQQILYYLHSHTRHKSIYMFF